MAKKLGVLDFLTFIRVHQYSKNLLIFVPLLLSHQYKNPAFVLTTLLGFLAFCFLATCVYIINDVIDIEADRAHHLKKHRALPSGLLSVRQAIALIPLFAIPFLGIVFYLPQNFLLTMIAYFAVTLAYSFYLKRIVLMDVFVLATLYTLRIIAGMAIISSPYSVWLISFSVFFFLSLAFVKRHSELLTLIKAKKDAVIGRGYSTNDAHALSIFGIVSGYASIVIFSLYLNSNRISDLYTHPKLLFLISFLLLFWISRVWLLATQHKVNEDPVLFALKDIPSFIIVVAIVAITIIATM